MLDLLVIFVVVVLMSLLQTLNRYLALGRIIPVNINLSKVNNRNSRNKDETCSKLIMKTPKQYH